VVPVVLLALGATVVGAGGAGASPPAASALVCSGGAIAPGTYASITVTGTCSAPVGNVVVNGNVTVAPGALLDAATAGDPPGNSPLLPASVVVHGNVHVGRGAVLLLGCSPFLSCSSGFTFDRIDGSLTADEAVGVLVHSTSVGGDISLVGGGYGTTCSSEPPVWLSDPSLANGEGPGTPLPVYSDLEDVQIGGNFRILGLQSCWLGAIRDQVAGSMTVSGNTMADPDANEIESNVVGGHLICGGNLPAVQFGDGGGSPNVVAGNAFGQCAFGRTLKDSPANGPVAVPIAVSQSSLGTYHGTRVALTDHTAVIGQLSSGDTILGSQGNISLRGAGLTGPGHEQAILTLYPDNSASFYAVDACAPCAFDGASGPLQIIATGHIAPSGLQTGSFLLLSGGSSNGGLATLAGWGTFTSAGQPGNTLALTEYLGLG
jgi:hypothetical protein